MAPLSLSVCLLFTYIHIYTFIYIYMYVCMHGCMYVCMCMYTYIYIYMHIFLILFPRQEVMICNGQRDKTENLLAAKQKFGASGLWGFPGT